MPATRPVLTCDGALVVDKPPGVTSHDVVAAVRRTTGVRRVGHTGTLDPMATGVLPLLLGRATRLAQFLAGARKVYDARVRLGWATDTYDATGRAVGAPEPVSIARERIEQALEAFRGPFRQRPPSYSAKKVHGVRAYALARHAAPPALQPVEVQVDALELVDVRGSDVALRVSCSAGFYVRSLAHDLGQALGVGAHLTELRRAASGAFTLAHAQPLGAILEEPEAALKHVVPLRDVLPDSPVLHLTHEGLRRVRHGQPPGPSGVAEHETAEGDRWVRLLAPDGSLAAIGDANGDPAALRPVVVLV